MALFGPKKRITPATCSCSDGGGGVGGKGGDGDDTGSCGKGIAGEGIGGPKGM